MDSREKEADQPLAVAASEELSLERSLPILCDDCHRPVTIEYEVNGDRGGRYRMQHWNCPHCNAPNHLNLAGRILKVERR